MQFEKSRNSLRRLIGRPEEDEASNLNHIIQDNINTIIEHRRQTARQRSMHERIADLITNFSGNMGFVFVHAIWFAAWLLMNEGWFGIEPFDPFPYGLLTMIVSLEAIFLSTFVLISQNRMRKLDQQGAELDLQINLLTERELTQVLAMLDEIQVKLGIDNSHHQPELEELKKETKPDEVMDEIERKSNELNEEVL